jgi:photosystem II stability/assembly factor-like uncharacterized protein
VVLSVQTAGARLYGEEEIQSTRMKRALFSIVVALPLITACGGGTRATPRASTTQKTSRPAEQPTSDPNFSTWVAPGDWVRIRAACVNGYSQPPPPYSGIPDPNACLEELSVAQVTDGPFGNGQDFPFYKLGNAGWVNEADFISPIDSISFVNRQHGWAMVFIAASDDGKTNTYRMYETRDAGNSWSAAGHDLTVRGGLFDSIEFVDDIHGWLHIGPYNDATVFATSDGGVTWTPAWKSTEPYGNAFESYSFASQNAGWRVIPTRLQRTTDGGRTWSDLDYPCVAERQYTAHVSFTSDRDGWLLCGTTYASDDFELYRTNDAGASWTRVASAGPTGAPDSLGSGAILISFQFLDHQTGWITTSADGARSGAFVTHDGGVTWSRLALKAPSGPPFWCLDHVQFVDANHGFVLVSRDNTMPGNLYETGDGGASWAIVQPPGDVLEATPSR